MSFLKKHLRGLLLIAAIFLTSQMIAGPALIPSGSMLPTLNIGDYVFVNRLAYGLHLPFWSTGELARWGTPQPGDVIVFNAPPEESAWESPYIKRVVAVAGDTLEVRDHRIVVNGQPATYQPSASGWQEVLRGKAHPVNFGPSPIATMPPVTIPTGHVFVMGDNRPNSSDSRVWGPLALERVRGRGEFVLFSLNLPKFRMFAGI